MARCKSGSQRSIPGSGNSVQRPQCAWLRGRSERRRRARGAGPVPWMEGGLSRGDGEPGMGCPRPPASAPILGPCPAYPFLLPRPLPLPEPQAMGTGGETLAGPLQRRARPQPLPFLGPGKRGHFCSQPPEGLGGPSGSGRKVVGNSRVPRGPDGILVASCTR